MKPIKFSLSLAAGIFLLANFCLAQSRYVYSVAGNGQFGFSGDNGPALNAQIDAPRGLCKDVEGNLYISDGMNSRIRKVNANTGAITTYAGNGGSGYSGNGGLAVNAQIGDPQGICLDNAVICISPTATGISERLISKPGSLLRLPAAAHSILWMGS